MRVQEELTLVVGEEDCKLGSPILSQQIQAILQIVVGVVLVL
jgi:hypothetical protein